MWLFSADSVNLIPKLAQVTSDHPLEKYLPAPLVSLTLLDTPLWRWIALIVLGAALAVGAVAVPGYALGHAAAA